MVAWLALRCLNWRCTQCWADDNHSLSDVYPAALKLVIRYHIRNLCSAQHCVDSLVIYLNSPTTSDGTMLLWDADHDGLVSFLTASPALRQMRAVLIHNVRNVMQCQCV